MASIAVLGTQDDMLEAARYFQTLPMQEDRAILLYHKVCSYSSQVYVDYLSTLGWIYFESN
jgi:hypothetical protein